MKAQVKFSHSKMNFIRLCTIVRDKRTVIEILQQRQILYIHDACVTTVITWNSIWVTKIAGVATLTIDASKNVGGEIKNSSTAFKMTRTVHVFPERELTARLKRHCTVPIIGLLLCIGRVTKHTRRYRNCGNDDW